MGKRLERNTERLRQRKATGKMIDRDRTVTRRQT